MPENKKPKRIVIPKSVECQLLEQTYKYHVLCHNSSHALVLSRERICAQTDEGTTSYKIELNVIEKVYRNEEHLVGNHTTITFTTKTIKTLSELYVFDKNPIRVPIDEDSILDAYPLENIK